VEYQKSVPSKGAREAVESGHKVGIESRHAASEHEQPICDLKHWSRSEKASARKVFDAALKRGFYRGMQETAHRANQIKEPAHLWDLENIARTIH